MPLSLLASYLGDRHQCVCIGSYHSSFLPLQCGVPQGSVLGPILFNLYVNGIVNIDTAVKYIIYADDCTLLFSGMNLDDVIGECNAVLNKLHLSSQSNCIRINPSKTKIIIFRARNKEVKLHQHFIYAGQEIAVVDEHKILGVTFSSNLAWHAHINHLCSKLSAATGALSRCRSLIPLHAKLSIYHALFASHLNYCSLVWLTTTKKNIEKIITLQKKIIRNVADVGYLSSTRTLFPLYNIVKIENMYNFRILRMFCFSSSTHKCFLADTASLTPNITCVVTRSTDEWFVPRFRTNYKFEMLHHNLPFILNSYTFLTFKDMRQCFVSM